MSVSEGTIIGRKWPKLEHFPRAHLQKYFNILRPWNDADHWRYHTRRGKSATLKIELVHLTPSIGWQVNQVKEPSDWPIDHACVGSNGYLAAASGETESKNLRRLTVWRMKSPSDVTYVQHWTFESDILGLHMDDRFIAVLLFPKSTQSKLKGVELQLISLETQKIERSLCLPSKDSADVAYGDGLLLFVELKGSIR